MKNISSQTDLLNWNRTENITITKNFTVDNTWTPIILGSTVVINGDNHTITTYGNLECFNLI